MPDPELMAGFVTGTPPLRLATLRACRSLRLKRVFKLDLTSGENCGSQVRVIACIDDPAVIGKILAHLETPPPVLTGEGRRPEVRGPPPGPLAWG